MGGRQGAQVLVVDDEEAVAETLARLLERAGIEVEVRTDPRQARQLLEERAFAVVISDNVMPGLMGVDLLQVLQERGLSTRRLLVTGYTDYESAVRAFNDGVIHRFLSKPWDGEEMIRAVEDELAQYAEAEETQRQRLDLERLTRRQAQMLRNALALSGSPVGAVADAHSATDSFDRAVTVLVADVEGYSRLMHEQPARTVQALTESQGLLLESVAQAGGRLVNAVGDSMLAEFDDATSAVRCATDAQLALAARRKRPGLPILRLRMGLATGTVIDKGGELYGDPVNIAARLQMLATADGLCISGTTLATLPGHLHGAFAALGPQRLHNIAEVVDAYQWSGVPLSA